MRKPGWRDGVLAAALCLTAQQVLAYSGEIYRVCGLDPDGDNYLSLRECGDTGCSEIMRLGPDTYMWTMEPSAVDGWRQVVPMRTVADMFSGNPDVGYVHSRFICEVD